MICSWTDLNCYFECCHCDIEFDTFFFSFKVIEISVVDG